jgi:hypothetical protein
MMHPPTLTLEGRFPPLIAALETLAVLPDRRQVRDVSQFPVRTPRNASSRDRYHSSLALIARLNKGQRQSVPTGTERLFRCRLKAAVPEA